MGKWSYGVILDAGSSGTRIHIYKWLKPQLARASASNTELNALPKIESVKVKKIHPGVSTFGDTPELVGPNHLSQLFEKALKHIPHKEVKNTPLFLLATAGMRLLPSYKQQLLLDQVCKYTRQHTQFQLPDCGLHVQVITGETEGLYGWMAANYLVGGFDNPRQHDHGKGHHTYGFLDMGGASAQIAFAPNTTEAERHANDLTLLRLRTLDGNPLEYKVFVTTWLGFGVNEARQRYVNSLATASPDADEIPDPCLPSGYSANINATVADPRTGRSVIPVHLEGTGKFSSCMQQTIPLLEKDAFCPDKPCSMHGVHLPAIDFEVNHFLGVSEYWHTTHEIFEMSNKEQAYDFHAFQARVAQFCGQDWATIKKGVDDHKWGAKVDEGRALEVCFKAAWLMNVLHDGIGVPREGLEPMEGGHNHSDALSHPKQGGYLDPFQAVDKVDGNEVSWTLGKMLLYASSQVPPAEDALAVGFGSNEPGIPHDFQYASVNQPGHPSNMTSDWHETMLKDSHRRIPGFFIFVAIVLLVLYIFWGKERRGSAFRKIRTLVGGRPGSSKRRRHLINKLFGHGNSPVYERVLEDGDGVNDFELPEVESDNEHSDSSEGSRRGRTSGWATPQLKVGFDSAPPPYFDSVAGAQASAGFAPAPGLTKNAMDRSGLMARVDSRERLAIGQTHRSGAASPTRLRSPLMSPLKESVD